MKTIPKVFWLWLTLISVMSHAEEAAEEWMPDANLRAAVREKLGLSNDVPLTKDNIKHLIHLEAQNREIRSIQGLEFAENLEVGLNLGGNLIQETL